MVDTCSQNLPLAPIVCGIDDAYARPLCALITSIGAAHAETAEQPRMIILHRRLTPQSRSLIDACAADANLALRWHEVEPAVVTGPVSGWVSAAAYLRFALPELAVSERRVLYLDADVLVLRDLTPLLRMPLTGMPLAAVQDAQNPIVGTGLALPGCDRIGVPRGRAYFNSGVLLADLETCAGEQVFERAGRFLADFPDQVLLWDQDALNVAADDRWLRLDRRWNTVAMSALARMPGFFHTTAEPHMPLAGLLADEETAAILHFTGPVKPWHPAFPAGALRTLYEQFLPPDVLSDACTGAAL
ncbi:glycosyltransferase family 8 protein [Hamadaea tsunoensis]|uniref:glycosyltransferase family 8 protein n=1 Tax=Hamadaea tsunoensis TaxID=53368 RepID=UPI000483EB42|nr:glycosyltransferase family 8 protein [Hamadaea tsunoensis]